MLIRIRIAFSRFQKFLPNFEKDDQMEKIMTLKILLGGGNMKFGNPVDDFKLRLSEGHYNPDTVKMNELLKKIDYRHCRYDVGFEIG